MAISTKNASVLALGLIAVAVALYLLAFGVAVLYGGPTRSFWEAEKFFYGFLPICASPVILVVTFRRWAHLYRRRRSAWLSMCVAVILALAADTVAFVKFRGHHDDRLRAVWNEETAVFDWGPGVVRLPAGFSYERLHGIDTLMGRFISKDGRLVVEYDIGELAGEHGGMPRSETLTGGSRVRVGSAMYTDKEGQTKKLFKVSFPDSGCASFSLESTRERDAAVIDSIASSFRPIGWAPSFLRPLLPEVLRSDCRYRVEWPQSFLNGVDRLGDLVDHLMGQG